MDIVWDPRIPCTRDNTVKGKLRGSKFLILGLYNAINMQFLKGSHFLIVGPYHALIVGLYDALGARHQADQPGYSYAVGTKPQVCDF